MTESEGEREREKRRTREGVGKRKKKKLIKNITMFFFSCGYLLKKELLKCEDLVFFGVKYDNKLNSLLF